MDWVGCVVGRQGFQLEAVVGRWPLGLVFDARSRETGRRVTVKLSEEGAGIAGLVRERDALARIASPHVPVVLEFGWQGRAAAFLVLEHLDGVGLHHWLVDAPPPRPTTVVAILEQVCRALAAAHDVKQAHGALGPRDVLVPAAGPVSGGVKVLGFGYEAAEAFGVEDSRARDLNAVAQLALDLLRRSTLAEPGRARLRLAAEPYRPLFVEDGPADGLPLELVQVISRASSPDPEVRPASVLWFARELALAVRQYGLA